MANLNLLVVESSGKQKRRPSSAESIDFLSLRIGASNIEISEVGSNLDFDGVKLVNIAAGTAAGEALSYSQRGAADGVASLDGSGKVPVSQLPSAVMTYEGVWNASTNTPALIDGTGDAGMLYRVSVAGSQDLGSGSISYSVGDYVIYNGSTWEKSDSSDPANTDEVSEGATNLYFTDERAQDAVGNNLLDTSSVNLSYNDGTGQISADVLPGGVDHDSLLNFVANEHIDHSSVSILTGANSGLSGGGDLTASRSPIVDPNNAPLVAAAELDQILIADESDSNALKKVTVQSILDLVGGSNAVSLLNEEGAAITVGQIVYIKTNGAVELAQANVAAIADSQLGIVKDASIADNASGDIFVKDGEIISGFTGLTIGAKLYVSRSVAGGYQQNLTGFVAGEMVYCIGRAISATQVAFDPEFEFEF